MLCGDVLLQRNAGSSSDGTEDSDFSTDPEHTDSSESDGTSRRSARVTRSSARLSQSSQGKGSAPETGERLFLKPGKGSSSPTLRIPNAAPRPQAILLFPRVMGSYLNPDGSYLI